MPLPVGVTLNNPFHIRSSAKNEWKGEVEQGPGEHPFERFQTVEAATRAFLIILNHYKASGVDTFKEIFARYAPERGFPLVAPAADRNDPAAYAQFVAQRLRKEWDTEGPNLKDPAEMLEFCQAVIRMECGVDPSSREPWYSDASIAAGISWAHSSVKEWH